MTGHSRDLEHALQ